MIQDSKLVASAYQLGMLMKVHTWKWEYIALYATRLALNSIVNMLFTDVSETN